MASYTRDQLADFKQHPEKLPPVPYSCFQAARAAKRPSVEVAEVNCLRDYASGKEIDPKALTEEKAKRRLQKFPSPVTYRPRVPLPLAITSASRSAPLAPDETL